MKTVTGGVIAVEPISLPKAATLLSSFASSENGATQDVGAYLRRASAAFTELKSLHVELIETGICSDERNQTRESDPVSQAESNERKSKESVEVEIDNENDRRKEEKKKSRS